MRDSYNNLEIFQLTISIKFEYIFLKNNREKEENTFERASRKFSRIKKTNGFLINCDALPRASN